MNQQENNPGPMEPEMIVWRLNYQITCNCHRFLGNLMGQLDNYMLQLSAHSKLKL